MTPERDLAETVGKTIMGHLELLLVSTQAILDSSEQCEGAELGFSVLASEARGWAWEAAVRGLREWYDTLVEPGED